MDPYLISDIDCRSLLRTVHLSVHLTLEHVLNACLPPSMYLSQPPQPNPISNPICFLIGRYAHAATKRQVYSLNRQRRPQPQLDTIVSHRAMLLITTQRVSLVPPHARPNSYDPSRNETESRTCLVNFILDPKKFSGQCHV